MSTPAARTTIYEEIFAAGPGAWCTGKTVESGTWHRNIFGERGDPIPLGWDRTGGRNRTSCAFTENPWYFDDNHGEWAWLYLAFFVNRSDDIGLQGRDLRGATIDLTLRGRGFRRQGTKLYFWIQSPAAFNWILSSQPIIDPLDGDEWQDVTVRLDPDETRCWTFMGLLNGGLSRKLRIIQSKSLGDGTLDAILAGDHVNFGFLLCHVDANDPPTGRIEVDRIAISK